MDPKQEIATAYDQSEWLYKLVWGLGKEWSMNYGYWEADTQTIRQAIINLRTKIAERLQLNSSAHLLDAGCGYGGTAVWLAQKYGCRITGITLSPRQIEKAKQLALEHEVAHLCRFELGDYHHLAFPDQHFTHYLALESAFHIQDKAKFLREAARVLCPGGRMVISDYWGKTDGREALLKQWFTGYHIQELCKVEDFSHQLKNWDFRALSWEDFTPHILPSSKRLYFFGKMGQWTFPLQWLFPKKMRVPKSRIESVIAQHKALEQDLWAYGIYSAIKPELFTAKSTS
ncbi:cyclopropane-fatty-acyl-phospholipid synthase family protein [Persicobacter sp. CCB-QB2]|uniref:SAM-dependent methyltransferase n=1 Tax=Persicobacter sp. CCB-QB2 TaxID=1561025 RepID=UPI0006A97AEB|nr:methyltransferase domain-containing protein [Persicobacter sp. CCB-QB2]